MYLFLECYIFIFLIRELSNEISNICFDCIMFH